MTCSPGSKLYGRLGEEDVGSRSCGSTTAGSREDGTEETFLPGEEWGGQQKAAL